MIVVPFEDLVVEELAVPTGLDRRNTRGPGHGIPHSSSPIACHDAVDARPVELHRPAIREFVADQQVMAVEHRDRQLGILVGIDLPRTVHLDLVAFVLDQPPILPRPFTGKDEHGRAPPVPLAFLTNFSGIFRGSSWSLRRS